MRQTCPRAVIVLLGLACFAAGAARSAEQAADPSRHLPPTLAIDPPARETQIGQSIEIAVHHPRSRLGSVIVVSLERTGGAGEAGNYVGPVGVIGVIRPGGRHAGVAHLRWNGATVGCSPEDSPTQCPIEPGRYRLRAALYPHGRFDPTPFLISRPAPRVISEVLSEPLRIVGPPNFTALQGSLRGGASEHVRGREVGRGFWMMGRSDALVDQGHDFRREPRGWCMDFRPIEPIDGTLTSCAPLSAVSDEGLQTRPRPLTFYGELTWPDDIVPATRAWHAAIELVPQVQLLGYVGWPRDAVGLERSIYASKYRDDLGAWLIMLHVPPSDASNAVVVSVEKGGKACLLTRMKSASLAEFEALRSSCPADNSP